MGEQAFSGLKVLDCTNGIAGPYCTKLLADFGAEVIKVESPEEGDSARRMGPFLGDEPHLEKSGAFFYLNTNKKSITEERQRQADEQGLAPPIGQSQHDRGEDDRRDGDLRTAKAENGAAHGPQAPWLELEPDHEQK